MEKHIIASVVLTALPTRVNEESKFENIPVQSLEDII